MNAQEHFEKNSFLPLAELIDEFLAYQSGVRSLSEHSVHAYKLDLYKMAELLSVQSKDLGLSENCDVNAISLKQLRSCIGQLSREKKAAASINRFIAAVRNFFAYCMRFGYIKSNVSLELKTVKQPVRVPRFMSALEAEELCVAPEKNELLWEARDRALFEILYSSGCRVAEIAGIQLADISANLDSALVTGKGGKDRRVFFSKEACKALGYYLVERKARILNLGLDMRKGVKTLFINQHGGNITERGIRFIVSRYSSVEGTNRHVSPHVFRHTFATTMIGEGADIRTVQEMLGHSSISTTQRYTHVTSEGLRALYKQAHPHGRVKN